MNASRIEPEKNFIENEGLYAVGFDGFSDEHDADSIVDAGCKEVVVLPESLR